MQNTRIVNLLDTIGRSLGQWFFNPWRRFSLLLISWLFGIFLGTAVSTTAGQKAELDIVIAAFLVFIGEIGSWIFYSRSLQKRRVLWAECLNLLKIGFTYSLFIEAFKLGS
ncbi:MAG: DUF565 domain-containing protein [Scytonematopsis contorta HA4267-MV1]|jgi:hypothetical protein|nr:DUF565 domain-containing protein [Scytonematopsis contorta HA4267-MV1]